MGWPVDRAGRKRIRSSERACFTSAPSPSISTSTISTMSLRYPHPSPFHPHPSPITGSISRRGCFDSPFRLPTSYDWRHVRRQSGPHPKENSQQKPTVKPNGILKPIRRDLGEYRTIPIGGFRTSLSPLAGARASGRARVGGRLIYLQLRYIRTHRHSRHPMATVADLENPQLHSGMGVGFGQKSIAIVAVLQYRMPAVRRRSMRSSNALSVAPK